MFGERKYYLDLQVHTSRYSSCSTIPPEQIIRVARGRGLDGVALTEHLQGWPPEELKALRASSGDSSFVVLAGLEVATRSGDGNTGDLLVFGVRHLPPQPCSIDEVCRIAHQQGGIVIAPHPFAGLQGIGDEVYSSRIDGLEVYNFRYGGPEPSRRAERAWRQLGLAGIASSDAHDLREIGRCCTEFDQPIAGEADFIEAILAGRCRPRRKSPPIGLWRRLSG